MFFDDDALLASDQALSIPLVVMPEEKEIEDKEMVIHTPTNIIKKQVEKVTAVVNKEGSALSSSLDDKNADSDSDDGGDDDRDDALLKAKMKLQLATDWYVIVFGPVDRDLIESCPLPIRFFPPSVARDCVARTLSLPPSPTADFASAEDEARAHQRSLLRATLADLLGLSKTNKMVCALEQYRYVLTPDLALKMIQVFARIRSGNNVVLVGDTGQGKTEMILFLSVFLNMDKGSLPYMIEELSELALNFVLTHYSTPLPNLPHALNEEHITRIGLIRFFKDIAHTAAPKDSETNESCWPPLRSSIMALVRKFLSRCPLLDPSPNILSILAAHEGSCTSSEHLLAVDDLELFLDLVLDMKPKKLFFKQMIYKGLPLKSLSSTICAAKEAALAHQNGGGDRALRVLLFLDEANTTSHMGHLKDLIADHRWGNEDLPSNLSIIAAINPTSVLRLPLGRNMEPSQIQTDFSKDTSQLKASDGRSYFKVRPPHQSLAALEFYFREMDPVADAEFWEASVELGHTEICKEEQNTIIKYVLDGQTQLREAAIPNVHPSIRDLVRALKIFKYFRTSYFGAILLGEATIKRKDASVDLEPELDVHRRPVPFTAHFWKALFMTLGLCYYLRLENHVLPMEDAALPPTTRAAFMRNINARYQLDRLINHKDVTFQKTLDDAFQFLYDHSTIPDAVAPTAALKENIFVTVVCTDMMVPYTICGLAGTSKTLSATIACDNMKGLSSTSPLFRHCARMHFYRYQCSEMSTDIEVDAKYEEGESRQEELKNNSYSGERHRCLVLFDELNLADNGATEPLKAIHPHLDKPKVVSGFLTNKILDPAKVNRTLQVFQTGASSADLATMALCCLFGSRKKGEFMRSPYHTAVIGGICDAYEGLSNGSWNSSSSPNRPHNAALTILESFQLRDFVYFLRSLRNQCLNIDTHTFELTPDGLLHAILRNFGGAMRFEDTSTLVNFVFTKINHRLRSIGRQLPIPEIPKTPIAILRSSIQDTIPLNEMNPNINSCRFVCLLDPTDSGIAVDLLFDLNVITRNSAVVITCSDFESDTNEQALNDNTMRLKKQMAIGGTAVIVGGKRISGSFYDLFNNHLRSIPVENFEPGESPVTHFANVAHGSVSRPSKVHPNAKIIFYLRLSDIFETPLPFLSRFERYVLTVFHCAEEKRICRPIDSALHQPGQSQLDALISGLSHFCNTLSSLLSGQHPLHGLVEQQTIFSLAISAFEHSRSGLILDPIHPVHTPLNGHLYGDLPPPDRSEVSAAWVQYIIKVTIFRLLQIAKPEFITRMNFLPKEYRLEYDLRQEHLSAANLIRGLVSDFNAPSAMDLQENASLISKDMIMRQSSRPSSKSACLASTGDSFNALHTIKAIISTRTSSIVSRLCSDLSLQEDLIGASNWPLSLFISTSAISSITAFEHLLNTNSGKRLIFICADMTNTTRSQLNDLRFEVDNYLRKMETEDSQHLRIFFILHHPPEHALSPHYAYPAIFWNDWNFFYVDSLGLWADETDEELAVHNQPSDANLARLDAREWIAKAHGLDVEIGSSSVLCLFRSTFYAEFPSLLKKIDMRRIQNLRHFPLHPSVLRIYSSSSDRRMALQSLFNDEPTLVDAILQQFAHYWTSSLLHHLVLAAGDATIAGKANDSLLLLIRNSLRQILISMCKNLVTAFLTNFNMQAVHSMLEEAKEPASAALADLKLQFLHAALRLVPAPTAESILQFNANNGKHDSSLPLIFVPPGKLILTSLPLFDLVVTRISSSVVSAMRASHSLSTLTEAFVPAFAGELQRSPPLMDILKLIDASPLLREKFYDDFAIYRLDLPILSESLRHVLRVIIDAQVAQIEKNGVRIAPACLFLIPPEFCAILSHLGFYLNSLNALNIPETATETFGRRNYEDVSTWDPPMIEIQVQLLTIDLLWQYLISCISSSSNFSQGPSLELWMEACGQLYSSIHGARWRRACSLSTSSLSLHHRMSLLFGLTRAYSLSPSELFDLVKLDQAEESSFLSDSSISSTSSCLLAVPSISRLVAAVRHVNMEDSSEDSRSAASKHASQTSKLAQSILRESLYIDHTVYSDPSQFEMLKDDISILLHIAADALPTDSCLAHSPEIFKYFDKQWAMGQIMLLYGQLTTHSNWEKALFSLAEIALESAHKQHSSSKFLPFLISYHISTFDFSKSELSSLGVVQGSTLRHERSNPLEYIWFIIWLEDYSKMDWKRSFGDYERLAGSSGMDHVRRVAASSSLLCHLAAAFSNAVSYKDAIGSWLSPQHIIWARNFLLPHNWRPQDLSQAGLPADPVPFLLFKIASCGDLSWFRSQTALLNDLGLHEWYQESTVDASFNLHYLPWMNPNHKDNVLHKYYKRITAYFQESSECEALLALIDSIAGPHSTDAPSDAGDPAANPPLLITPRNVVVLQLRMVLFMAVYQCFLFRGRRCTLILENLNSPDDPLAKRLDLTAMEIKAFQFISLGLRKLSNRLNVLWYFSEECFNELDGYLGMDAQLLVNTMATILGCPRASNHMYPLAFDALQMDTETTVVGSTFQWHADCGFKWESSEKPLARVNPPIMGNVMRHRLVLNASYWAAFSWAALLYGEVLTPHVLDATVLNYVPQPRSAVEVTRYIFTRAQCFAYSLTHQHPSELPNTIFNPP